MNFKIRSFDKTSTFDNGRFYFMKSKLLELLKEKKEIHLTKLPIYLPEIKGEFSMCLPTKEYNKNVLLLSGVSEKFISVYNELLKDGIIELKESTIVDVIFEHSIIYDLPLLGENNIKTQEECWQPTKIVIK